MEDRKAESGTLWKSVESMAGREAGKEWSNNQDMCWPLHPGEGHWRYSDQEALVMQQLLAWKCDLGAHPEPVLPE